jgi:CRISPR-associated protein Cas5h
MNFKEILIFDISGEYGHFRKYNTTTSPLTYSIPTRTAIAGMLGAILGMEREICDGVYPEGAISVQEFFSKENAEISIQILNPVKKVNIGFNLLNIDKKSDFYRIEKRKNHFPRTQIEFELLKYPKYRVFFGMNDNEKFKELTKRIKKKNHHFTPYFGLAQFTADIEFVDLTEFKLIENNNADLIEIITAVNLSQTFSENPVEFDYSAMYAANNTPIEMNKNREVQEYSEVLIEKNGKPIKAKVKKFYTVSKYGNIAFL